jgi:hypothetical protein
MNPCLPSLRYAESRDSSLLKRFGMTNESGFEIRMPTEPACFENVFGRAQPFGCAQRHGFSRADKGASYVASQAAEKL